MEMDEIKNEKDKKEYEVAFLVREEGGAEAVRNLIVRHGGEVVSAGPVRRIALAYKIKKEAHACFGFFRAMFPPAAVPAFTTDLRTSGATLRFLIVTPVKVRKERTQPREIGDVPQKPRVSTAGNGPLSNEALEKKIEEILQ